MKLSDVPWDKVAKAGFVLVSTFAGVSAVNSHMEVGKIKAERVAEKAASACPICPICPTKMDITHVCAVRGELVLPKR